MLFAFIFVLLGASQIKAYAFDNATALETVDGGRLSGGSATTGTTYDWIVSIHDISGASPAYKAPGVAYNANWVLTTEGAVTAYLTAAEKVKLGVYVALANTGTVGTATKHRVKDFSLPTGLTKATILHDLVALKVCPPLTTFATLGTAAAASSAVGTAASYVNFNSAGVKEIYTARKIGYTCQCADYTNYNTAYHFCLDEEDTNKIVAADGKATVCIIGGNFAGFNVDVQNLGGEPYLDIFQYKVAFLNTLT